MINAPTDEPVSDWYGRRVMVCFDYDIANAQPGTIVADEPIMPTVIQLDTGEFVLGTQCQWRVMTQKEQR